jgi:hypothetical protein
MGDSQRRRNRQPQTSMGLKRRLAEGLMGSMGST